MKALRGQKWRAALSTPVGAAASVILVCVVAMAVVGPMIWGDSASRVDTAALSRGPGGEHLLGTDGLGRDILARVLVATRQSVLLAVTAALIGVVTGGLIGALPSVLGRRSGRIIKAAVDLAVAFPGLLLAIFLAVVFGVGARGAVLALGLAAAPSFARLTQTLAASVAGKDYVAAARVVGVGRLRILLRHILPNIAEPLLIIATIGAGGALLAFAGLSFLGLGVQAPAYDWGVLLNEGLNRIYVNPAAALAPGVAVILAGLAFNLFGETLAQVVGLRTPVGRVRRWSRGLTPTVIPESPQDIDVEPVLRVVGLHVSYPTAAGWATPVENVSFDISPGEAVGIVGESGSGKSLTALAATKLIPAPGVVRTERLEFLGEDLQASGDRELRRVLGTSLAMVFQDPVTSLNPALRVGRQLAEVAEVHEGLSRTAARERAVDRLRKVVIPAAERAASQYPHEFSGGMRQRTMIAMGLMGSPRLIVADEPTTALDVVVQRQVLRLLQQVRQDSGAAILLISHDIAVVTQMCERVLVMYGGTIVEDLTVPQLFAGPAHPYTRALLDCVPDMECDRERPLMTIQGSPPEPHDRPPGCPFAPRCPARDAKCDEQQPPLEIHGSSHRVACWHPVDRMPDVAMVSQERI